MPRDAPIPQEEDGSREGIHRPWLQVEHARHTDS